MANDKITFTVDTSKLDAGVKVIERFRAALPPDATCADCRYFGVKQPGDGYADPVELRAAKKDDTKYFGECLFHPPSGPTQSVPETRVACRAFGRRERDAGAAEDRPYVPGDAWTTPNELRRADVRPIDPASFFAGPSLSQLRRRAQGLRELLRLEVEYQEDRSADGLGAVVGVLRTAEREAEQLVAGLFAAERREAER